MQLIKIVKIAIGSAIAISIASVMDLSYAGAAGIITLLTLQDTKKATLFVAIKRFIAFFAAFAIAYAVFQLFSYSSLSFGIFLLFFTGLCFYFKMEEAIPINAVLVTHYLAEKTLSLTMFINEGLLLLIGVGIGITLNLYIPKNTKKIRTKQRIIEDSLRQVLLQMSDDLLQEVKLDNRDRLIDLKHHVDYGLEQAYQNMKNTLFQDTRYYITYMEMRSKQYVLLNEIQEKILTLYMVPIQAKDISDFIRQIAAKLSEHQNTRELFVLLNKLWVQMENSPLPITREEFENRAILYVIIMDFRMFLQIKKDFVDELTKQQKEQYWEKPQHLRES